MRKKTKWLIPLLFLLLCLIIIPITFSKYVTSINRGLTLNAHQPEYDVVFNQLLPDEYQELEYIILDGYEYINTSIDYKANMKFEAKVYSSTTNKEQAIFGLNDKGSIFELFISRSGLSLGIFSSQGNETYTSLPSGISEFNNHTLIVKAAVNSTVPYKEVAVKIDNNDWITNQGGTSTPASAGSKIRLFNVGVSDNSYTFEGKVYYAKIYDGNELVGNYIPCYRKSDDAIGMYDMVTKTFHESDGTGSFAKDTSDDGNEVPNGYHEEKIQHFVYGTAQNLLANDYTRTGFSFDSWNTQEDNSGDSYEDEEEVNNLITVHEEIVNLYAQWEGTKYIVLFNQILPNEYQELEYIESDGNQYIDTEIVPDLNTKIEANLAFVGSQTMYNYLGSRSGASGAPNDGFGLISGSGQGKIALYRFRKSKHTINYDNDWHTYILSNTEASVDGVDYEFDSDTVSNITHSMYLFGFNQQGSAWKTSQKFKNVKIYNGTTLIRDYVPCYRKSDDVTGLYDMVTKTFYENDGTGSFTRGNEVTNGYHDAKSQLFVYGTAQNLSANNYTKDGYVFDKWNTLSNGTGISYVDQELVNNLTTVSDGEVRLYAKWRGREYDVAFNDLLPDEYQEVEYIYAANTYFDTGVIPSDTLKMDITFVDVAASGSNYLLGSRQTSSSSIFGIAGTYAKKDINMNYYPTGFTFNTTRQQNTTYNMIYEIESDNNNYRLHGILNDLTNNTSYERYGDYSTGLTETYPNIMLFALRTNQMHAGMKLYSLKIWDDGVMLRSYVPCIRKSDDAVGLYDMVTKTFSVAGTSAGQETTNAYHPYKYQHFIYGTAQNLLANTNTKTGYAFDSWNTNMAGTGTPYYNQELVKNLTNTDRGTVNLYAQWHNEAYTVAFNQLLPGEYQELDYIESNGNQYILTDIYPGNQTGVYTKIAPKNVTSDRLYFGVGNTNNNRYWAGTINGYFYYGWNSYNNDLSMPAQINETYYVYFNYLNNRKYIVNNFGPKNLNGIASTKTDPMSILGYNNGIGAVLIASTKLYEFKVTQGKQLIGNFIPCYRISDDETGLYDMVTKTFYSNDGAGAFARGNEITNGYHEVGYQEFLLSESKALDENTYSVTGYTFNSWNTEDDGTGTAYEDEEVVSELSNTDGDIVNLYAQWKGIEYTVLFSPNRANLPSTYTELEYIESDGTQYIDTGFTPNQDTRMVVDFELVDGYRMFGAESRSSSSSSSSSSQSFRFGRALQNMWFFAYGNQGLRLTGTFNSNRHLFEINKNEIYLDNTLVSTYTYEPFTSYGNAYLLQINSNYFNIEADGSQGKLYGAKIYDNNVLVRNFIPCFRNSDGVAGLYDTINDVFYTNENSEGNDFVKGYVSQDFVYDTAQDLTANTYVRDGYVFDEWNTLPDGTGTSYQDEEEVINLTSEADGIVKLYARWVKEVTVTFNPNGGSSTENSRDVLVGKPYGTLPTASKTGYTFLGWYNFTRHGNITLTARNTGAVTDNSNYTSIRTVESGITYTITMDSAIVTEGEATQFTTAIMNSQGSPLVSKMVQTNFGTNLKYDITVPERDATKTLLLYSGVSGSTRGIGTEYNNVIVWTNGAEAFNNNTIVFMPFAHTLTAIYRPNTYEVAFDANEPEGETATGSMANQEFTYDITDSLTANAYEIDDYEFDGWNTLPDGSGDWYDDEEDVMNLTSVDGDEIVLYAQWTPTSTLPPGFADAAQTIMNSCTGTCLSTNGNDGTPNADGLFQDRYGDYRYQGSDPNNYVTFNGTEVWRIVGLFDIDGEKRVKLVKAASLGSYSWDTNVSIGINEWSQAKLQQELNGEYLDLTLTANTRWYNGSGNKQTAIFYYIRRLNADSQALIAPATWYLGGVPGSGAIMPLHTTYAAERGSQHPNTTDGVTRTDEWEGLVGLIYPSDFGYASANPSCADGMTVTDACTDNWMNSYGWTISPSDSSGTAGKTASSGKMNNNGVNGANPVRPAVYLVSGVLMGPTDFYDTTNTPGSSANPYLFMQ